MSDKTYYSLLGMGFLLWYFYPRMKRQYLVRKFRSRLREVRIPADILE